MLFGVITILPFLSLSLSRAHTHIISLTLSLSNTFSLFFTLTKDQSYVIKLQLQFVAKIANYLYHKSKCKEKLVCWLNSL